MSGLFNIAMVAAKAAIKKNMFTGGKTIEDKQQEYMYASNPITRFIDDLCDLSDPDECIPKNELYNQYVLWSKDRGERVHGKGKLTQYLETIGVTTTHPTIDDTRVWSYAGICIVGGT